MAAVAETVEIVGPLFESAHDALRFAFLFSGQQYPMTIMGKMMRGIIGSGRGLSGLDGAAQAGMILGMLSELSPVHQAAITARYVDDADRRFMQSVNKLAMEPAVAPSGVSHRLERQALVARYFGQSVNLGEVAEKIGAHRNTVGQHNRFIRDRLDAIESLAYNQIADIMISRSLIYKA